MERRKKKEKKKKDMWFGKEETKLPLFADDIYGPMCRKP